MDDSASLASIATGDAKAKQRSEKSERTARTKRLANMVAKIERMSVGSGDLKRRKRLMVWKSEGWRGGASSTGGRRGVPVLCGPGFILTSRPHGNLTEGNPWPSALHRLEARHAIRRSRPWSSEMEKEQAPRNDDPRGNRATPESSGKQRNARHRAAELPRQSQIPPTRAHR
jgi:hypothetical protein